LERMIAPAPREIGSDGTRLIELERAPVLRRGRIGRYVRVFPKGTACEQPNRPVVGRRIAFRDEGRTGIRIVAAALGEPLHLLVVLEDGVSPDRRERVPRDVEREVLEAVGLDPGLVMEPEVARKTIDLSRDAHRSAILV